MREPTPQEETLLLAQPAATENIPEREQAPVQPAAKVKPTQLTTRGADVQPITTATDPLARLVFQDQLQQQALLPALATMSTPLGLPTSAPVRALTTVTEPLVRIVPLMRLVTGLLSPAALDTRKLPTVA